MQGEGGIWRSLWEVLLHAASHGGCQKALWQGTKVGNGPFICPVYRTCRGLEGAIIGRCDQLLVCKNSIGATRCTSAPLLSCASSCLVNEGLWVKHTTCLPLHNRMSGGLGEVHQMVSKLSWMSVPWYEFGEGGVDHKSQEFVGVVHHRHHLAASAPLGLHTQPGSATLFHLQSFSPLRTMQRREGYVWAMWV